MNYLQSASFLGLKEDCKGDLLKVIGILHPYLNMEDIAQVLKYGISLEELIKDLEETPTRHLLTNQLIAYKKVGHHHVEILNKIANENRLEIRVNK